MEGAGVVSPFQVIASSHGGAVWVDHGAAYGAEGAG